MIKVFSRKFVTLSLGLSLLCFSGHSFALQDKAEQQIPMSFSKPTSLLELTEYLMKKEVLTKNLIFKNSLLEKKISLLNNKDLTKAHAKDLFVSILREHKLSLIETDSFAKIVSRQEGETSPSFTIAQNLRSNDTFTATLIHLDAIELSTIQPILSYFLRGQGKVVKHSNQSLMLMGPSNTLKKLVFMLDDLKSHHNKKLWSIALKNFPADDVLNSLQKLGIVSKEKGSVKVLVSDHSNSLLVYGTKDQHKTVMQAVKPLEDRPQAKNKGQSLYVRPLEFAEAKKIADTLGKIKKKLSPPGFFRHLTHIKSGLPKGDYHVIADEATNSLLIDSTYEQYKDLNKVIRELDKKQAQMFFDVHILEIKKGFQFTFKTNGLGFFNDSKGETSTVLGWEAKKIFPALKTDDTKVQDKLAAISKDLVLGVIKNNKVSINSLKEVDTGAFLQLLSEDSFSRVVSSPFLLSNTGEEASFQTGSAVPYQVKKYETKQIKDGPATTTEVTSIEKENSEISLKVNAHTTKTNELNMKLDLEIKAILNFTQEGYPETSQQRFSQEFSLRNGQTIFIGGFNSTGERKANKRVPFLSDLPLIGKLFTNTNPGYEDKKLLIFITPYICWGPSDLKKIYDLKSGDSLRG